MRRMNVYITPQQHEKLTELSEKSGVSVAELIRRALDQFLEARERQALWGNLGANPETPISDMTLRDFLERALRK